MPKRTPETRHDRRERQRAAAEKLRDPDTFTLTVIDVADALGVSHATAWRDAHDTGTIAGFPVIRAGRRMILPAQPVREFLGIRLEHDQHDLAPDPGAE